MPARRELRAALVLGESCDSGRVVGKPEVILSRRPFGGQVVSAFTFRRFFGQASVSRAFLFSALCFDTFPPRA
jgi:hypothetical protein